MSPNRQADDLVLLLTRTALFIMYHLERGQGERRTKRSMDSSVRVVDAITSTVRFWKVSTGENPAGGKGYRGRGARWVKGV